MASHLVNAAAGNFMGAVGVLFPGKTGIPDPQNSGASPARDYSRESLESKTKPRILTNWGKPEGFGLGGILRITEFHGCSALLARDKEFPKDGSRVFPVHLSHVRAPSRDPSSLPSMLGSVGIPFSSAVPSHKSPPGRNSCAPSVPAHPEGKAAPGWIHPQGLSHHALPPLPLLFHLQRDFREEVGCW